MKRDWTAGRFTFRAFAPGTVKGAPVRPRAGVCVALAVMALVGAWISRALIHQGSGAAGVGSPGQASWWQARVVHAQNSGSPAYTSFDAHDAGTGVLQGTAGLSINTAGDVAGTYLNAPSQNVTNLAHGFLRVASSGAITEFDAPDAGTGLNQGTFAISIDAADDVAGQSGQATFTVTPENGFNSAVSFSCSGLPAEASCSFNPTSVTPSGAAVTSTLTVSTTAASSAQRWPGGWPKFPAHAVLAMMGAALIFAVGKRRRRALAVFQFAALCGFLAIATGLASCSSNATGDGNMGTPPGTSAIFVSAAAGAGGSSHAATLSITVTR